MDLCIVGFYHYVEDDVRRVAFLEGAVADRNQFFWSPYGQGWVSGHGVALQFVRGHGDGRVVEDVFLKKKDVVRFNFTFLSFARKQLLKVPKAS